MNKQLLQLVFVGQLIEHSTADESAIGMNAAYPNAIQQDCHRSGELGFLSLLPQLDLAERGLEHNPRELDVFLGLVEQLIDTGQIAHLDGGRVFAANSFRQ